MYFDDRYRAQSSVFTQNVAFALNMTKKEEKKDNFEKKKDKIKLKKKKKSQKK